MTKNEFETILGRGVSAKEYEVIEAVYNTHPSISNLNGKSEIAYLYKNFGIRVILDMLPTAQRAAKIEDEIRVTRIRLDELQNNLKQLGKGDY